MWLTEQREEKMKKLLPCLCDWGRVRSRSSEIALMLQGADLLQVGGNRESGSVFQKWGRNMTLMVKSIHCRVEKQE